MTQMTHPVHFQLDTPSRSSQYGHRCTRPASVQSHQNTNSTLWTCVPARWPGTPSHHPLLCKDKCCCRSWLKPGAVQRHGECSVMWFCKGRGRKTLRWKEPDETYLLGRVPHNVLDILRVRVHNCNTFVLVFFVHCETQRNEFRFREPGSGTDRSMQFMPLRLRHKPSQTQTLLSRLHVARRFPEGAHATHLTSFSWPSSTVKL